MHRFFIIAALLCGVFACDQKPTPPPTEAPVVAPISDAAKTLPADRIAAGKAVVQKFECNRCHTMEEVDPPVMAKDCVGCHRVILDGTYDAPEDKLKAWQTNIKSLLDTPDLTHASRFRRDWLIAFLQNPHDLRQRLPATMPRMPISDADAEAIADYLLRVEAPESSEPFDLALKGKGKTLTNQKGCWSCHNMSGVDGLLPSGIPAQIDAKQLQRAMLLAPDLAFTAERFRADKLVDWLQDPAGIKPDAIMPSMGLTRDEAAAIAAFLGSHKRQEPSAKTVTRPEPLGRRVRFAEVQEKVLERVCAHCHLDPARGRGDGGPGNTGGLGFSGQGLDFTRYQAARKGSVRRDQAGLNTLIGEAQIPRITAHLLERHNEERGIDNPDIAGMPLGHPAIPMEDIQLIDAWVASGMPR